jgi:hypothetical protein
MAEVISADQLSQGTSSAETIAWTGASGATITLTGTGLPAIAAGEYFEIRDHSQAENNGLYVESGGTPTTSSVTADKVSGANPSNQASEAVTWLGDSNTLAKNVMFDTSAKEIYLLKQGALSDDGVGLDIVYKFIKEEWKDDDYLNSFPFPIFAIDTDAGKYIMGTDGQFKNGWNWKDVVSPAINTRKLIRSAGWEEQDVNGAVLAQWAGIQTLGSFEDNVNDLAYYQFGTDTTVDDTVDFDFAGPVNEAVQCFERLADNSINGGTGVVISADGRTMTRSDGGNWRTDGFKVGGAILLRDSENAVNDGSSFLLSSVANTVDGAITIGTEADAGTGFSFLDGGGGNDQIQRFDGGSWVDEGYYVGGVVVVANATTVANDGVYTILAVTDSLIDVATASFTADTADNTATFGPLDDTNSPDTTVNASIDNRSAFATRLRIRDADPNGKTFDSSDLDAAGESALSNRLFKFPLSNVTDLKISAADTDIDANSDGTADVAPYTGMSITYYSTPQSIGGYVGGSYNFGIIIDANGGTAQEVYEFVQWSLRSTGGNGTGDIDADADTAIGRAMDELLVFEGDTLISGKSIPRNPDGGGTGVAISNIAAADQNNIRNFDNTGTQRQFPETISVTLDFNNSLIDDTVATYDLYFDRTIRTTVTDLVINAGTGDTGTFTSAGSNLPASLNRGVGAYVRISGLTGADAAMNGVYQVTSISASTYNVRRWDGKTIVTTSSASVPLDENCIDTPDSIIVQDDTPADVSGLASADVNFAFDFDGNVQGGRPVSTDTYVVARALGISGAQYVQSSVQVIQSGTPLTIVLTASNELNVAA